MNYKKIYDQLIKKAQQRNLKKFDKNCSDYVYLERHHIIPKSLGGSNDESNLVNLTYREHYFAHLLLVKYYKQIGSKNRFFKMVKALDAFKNLNYGTIRNNIFFASSLYKNLVKDMTMPDEVKEKLSASLKGKKWSNAQRAGREKYFEKMRALGIKIIPWNKGVPLAQETKDKMHKTILKYGNKNKGRKTGIIGRVNEIRKKLSNKYKTVDFSDFDFETYAAIPKNAKFSKKYGKLYGKYKRHVMLVEFLKTQLSEEQIAEIMSSYNDLHPCGCKGLKISLPGQIKHFKTKFEKYYKLDFSDFDFGSYFNIQNENLNMRKQLRKEFVMEYVNFKEACLEVLYFF